MPSPEQERARIMKILQDNSHLDFVQRILAPNNYPTYDFGDGTHGTHLMTDAEVEGKGVVYPTLIYNAEKKQLRLLDPDRAHHHAMNTGEYISFDKPEDASWFAENYKKVWRQ